MLGFDPHHGADQARNYAGKYASTAVRKSVRTISLSHGPCFEHYRTAETKRCRNLPARRKPEKFYYLETSSNGLKDFLKCRTVGLCITHNRLLNCHVVRSTKPVHYIDPVFIPARDKRMPREETHLAKYPSYPACWRKTVYTKHATRRAGRVALDREYMYMCGSVRVPVGLLSINRTRTST